MKNGFKGGVASLEGDNLVVIYYFTICPDGVVSISERGHKRLDCCI
jgi:hypothetical protein